MLMLLCAVTTLFAQTLPATNKAFKLENDRGALAINNDGTALIGTPNVAIADVAQKNFAFVQYDGKVYLYSVWAEKFVNKDCSLTNLLPVDAITVENVADGKFFFKYDDAHNVNLGGSGQIAVNSWGTKDAGNQFTLVENGDFDPTAALAILDNSCTITYNFTYNGNVVATQVTKINKGANYPAFTSLPWGAVATVPTGTADADETLEIACTLDTEVLPFVPSATYDDANMKWYYVKIKDTYYLSHTAGQNHIALNDAAKAIDQNNKDAFTWAFVGNPFLGYQIVNRATGSTHVLSSSTSVSGNDANVWPVMTETPVPSGNNEYWMATSSQNIDKGFYLAQKDIASNRMNNRDGKLAYWTGGADAGSTFTVIERPMGPVAELEALIAEAEALLNANSGSKIGEYTAATSTALSTAIATAKAIEEANITAADVEALQAAIDGLAINLPTAGKYYQLHSSLAAFAETKAVHGTDGTPGWKTLNNDDKNFYWKAVATGNGIALQNAANGKYLCGNDGKSGAWSLSETPSEIDVKIFSKAENEKGYEYGVILNGWQMHANNHGGGANASGNLVSWNTDAANSASSWFILEVELEEFFIVTYNFKYNGDVKYSHSVELAKGAAFPSVDAALPYGVTSNFAVPEGTVTGNATFDFNLTVETALPFKTAASAADITTWYYARMHTNQPGYIGDIAEDNSINVAWGKSSDVANDNYVWGFVGDVFSGITVVNKGTGKQLTSTGGGNVTLTDNGTAFFVARTTETSANATNGFCLRRNDSNQYLNANYSAAKLSHWGSTDAGSTIFLTKYEEADVTVSDVDWATMYLGYAVYVPENVNVYAVTGAENGYVTKSLIEGVIPANTGVLLENAGEYTFVKAAKDVAAIEGNLLNGSVEDTYVEGAAYVLANGENGVGFYKAALNKDAEGNEGTTHFKNNAGKAYLVLPAAESSAAYYGFDWAGTTAVEDVVVENEVKVIYDLTGRRVEAITAAGIYIVNGKKVLVK